MRRILACAAIAAIAFAGTARAADPELKTDDDKTLYALGLVIANQLGTFNLTPAELDMVKAGLTDATLKQPAKVDLDTYGPKIQGLAQQRKTLWVADQKKHGKEYLAKIAEKPGIKKTGTGLMMETITEGTGPSPVPTDKIKVNYKGTTIDGHVFDSSEKKGGPATISLTQVIKCWSEAFEFMKVGGKAKLYCPPDIAYGDHGNGPDIPPGATLVFDVELVGIEK